VPIAIADGASSIANHQRRRKDSMRIVEAPGGVRVRGTHSLSMKSFGLKPPTMFMGMLKTDDKVTVKFELQLVW
jgi:hypothetical protein